MRNALNKNQKLKYKPVYFQGRRGEKLSRVVNLAKKNIGTKTQMPQITVSVRKEKKKDKKIRKHKSKGPKVFIVLLSLFIVIAAAAVIFQNWDRIMPQNKDTTLIKEAIIQKESGISNTTDNIATAVVNIDKILNAKNTNTSAGGN